MFGASLSAEIYAHFKSIRSIGSMNTKPVAVALGCAVISFCFQPTICGVIGPSQRDWLYYYLSQLTAATDPLTKLTRHGLETARTIPDVLFDGERRPN